MVVLAIALSAALTVFAAEWLHARRIARVRTLLFAPVGLPRAWVRWLPAGRAVAVTSLAWGLLVLLTIDGRSADAAHRDDQPTRHLLIALDVSPSMYIEDAGPDARQTRGRRAFEVLGSVLERLDLARTRVSIVAFYSSARPVVVGTEDLNVVENVLRDLPLGHAFKEGQTNMYAGVREAAAIAEAWPPNSATLLVVSDGDTLPEDAIPRTPRSIADTIVLGVGDPYRGTQIAGRSSRQDTASLQRLALRLGGIYHDGNTAHLPTAVIERLGMFTLRAETQTPLRTLALASIGLGAAILAAISPALALFALPRRLGADHTIPLHSSSHARALAQPA